MLRETPRLWIAVGAICLSVVVLTDPGPVAGNRSEDEVAVAGVARDAVEDEEDREEFDEDAARQEFRELQERLEQIEQEIEDAEEAGDRNRVEDLRAQGERILDELDELQRRFGIEEFEGDERELEELAAQRRELEMHLQHLELERGELELRIGRLELARQMAEVAGNAESATAYAVMHAEEHMELEEAIRFLEEMLEQCDNAATRRLIHIKLAQVYPHVERPEAAREHLEQLILGE